MTKIAFVTGGSGGIGKATVRLLAQSGYRVYECSRGGTSDAFSTHLSADVTHENNLRDAVRSVLEKEGRIDLLVSNAGFGVSGAVECTETVDAKAQFEVNFFGALRAAQAVIPAMRAAGSGTIIFVSSVAAPIAIPFQSFYSASKAALNSLALALRNELRPFGVRVCAVQPGDVKTGFTAARKKSTVGSEIYGATLERAVAAMEHDEQNGMPPEAVANEILRAASARRPKALWTVGGKYKVFLLLNKILPATLVNYLVGLIYR